MVGTNKNEIGGRRKRLARARACKTQCLNSSKILEPREIPPAGTALLADPHPKHRHLDFKTLTIALLLIFDKLFADQKIQKIDIFEASCKYK